MMVQYESKHVGDMVMSNNEVFLTYYRFVYSWFIINNIVVLRFRCYSQNDRGSHKLRPHPHVCLTVCNLVPTSEQLVGFHSIQVEGVVTERCPDSVSH